jgi:hypothetical protein
MARIRTVGLAMALLVLMASSGRSQGVAFGPQIGTAPDGVIFPVTPVATADRRYVRMSLSPQFYGFQGFDTITVPAAVGGGGVAFGGFGGNFGGGFGNGLIGGPPGMASPYGPGMYGYGTTLTTPAFNPLINTIQSQVGRRRR